MAIELVHIRAGVGAEGVIVIACRAIATVGTKDFVAGGVAPALM